MIHKCCSTFSGAVNLSKCRHLTSFSERLQSSTHQQRPVSNSPAETASDEGNSEVEIAPSPPGKNKKLAQIIREGLGLLNQTSKYIQSAPITKKPLKRPHLAVIDDDRRVLPVTMSVKPPTDRQLAAARTLRDVAEECIEAIVDHPRVDAPGLSIQGDPIVIADVHISVDLRHATLLWTLPYSLLFDEISLLEGRNKDMTSSMARKIEMIYQWHDKFLESKSPKSRPAAVIQVQKCVGSKLSSMKYVPIVRFEAAPPLLVMDLLGNS